MADSDALAEKIEGALWGLTRVYDAPNGGNEAGVHAPVHEVVAAVLPLLAEEVRAGSEKAWDEATRNALNFAYLNQEDGITLYLRPPHNRNPHRANRGDLGE